MDRQAGWRRRHWWMGNGGGGNLYAHWPLGCNNTYQFGQTGGTGCGGDGSNLGAVGGGSFGIVLEKSAPKMDGTVHVVHGAGGRGAAGGNGAQGSGVEEGPCSGGTGGDGGHSGLPGKASPSQKLEVRVR